MRKTEVSAVGGTAKVKSVIWGIGIAYFFTLVMLFLLALIITYTSFDEDFSNTAVSAVGAAACAISGIFAAKGASSRGYLHGGIAAFFYRLFLNVAGGMIFFEPNFGARFFLSLGAAFFFGAIGGIIGINVLKH